MPSGSEKAIEAVDTAIGHSKTVLLIVFAAGLTPWKLSYDAIKLQLNANGEGKKNTLTAA